MTDPSDRTPIAPMIKPTDETAKPCPWCGWPPRVLHNTYKDRFDIECMTAWAECPARVIVKGETREEAIAAWNRRAPAAVDGDVIEEAARAMRAVAMRSTGFDEMAMARAAFSVIHPRAEAAGCARGLRDAISACSNFAETSEAVAMLRKILDPTPLYLANPSQAQGDAPGTPAGAPTCDNCNNPFEPREPTYRVCSPCWFEWSREQAPGTPDPADPAAIRAVQPAAGICDKDKGFSSCENPLCATCTRMKPQPQETAGKVETREIPAIPIELIEEMEATVSRAKAWRHYQTTNPDGTVTVTERDHNPGDDR